MMVGDNDDFVFLNFFEFQGSHRHGQQGRVTTRNIDTPWSRWFTTAWLFYARPGSECSGFGEATALEVCGRFDQDQGCFSSCCRVETRVWVQSAGYHRVVSLVQCPPPLSGMVLQDFCGQPPVLHWGNLLLLCPCSEAAQMFTFS